MKLFTVFCYLKEISAKSVVKTSSITKNHLLFFFNKCFAFKVSVLTTVLFFTF
jgi:hypothetical protein